MKINIYLLGSVLLASVVTLFPCRATYGRERSLVELANPLQGTDSSFDFSYGNTYPAIALPFPMNLWTAYTQSDSFFYAYSAQHIRGFRQTHQPSPHMGDYGAFAFMPVSGKLVVRENDRLSRFRHETEFARPSYYRVNLDTAKALTEISPTERGASFRVTFSGDSPRHIVFDGFKGEASFEILPEQNKIVGRVSNNGGGVPLNFSNHFVVVFDRPFFSHGTWMQDTIKEHATTVSGKQVGVFVSFDSNDPRPVTFRSASSFINLEQAERTLEREIGRADFDTIVARADKVWNETLGLIEIDGASDLQRRTFYSAFYRTLLFPNAFFEIDGNGQPHYYSPYDGKVHAGTMYTNSGLWDTFRAVHPFFNLMFPRQSGEILGSLVAAFEQSGYLPAWSSPGHRPIMLGNHAFSLLADGLVKGIGGFDLKQAVQAVIHDAHTEAPKTMRTVGRQGATSYDERGYVSHPEVGESVSKTLEYAYNDFCAAVLTRADGEQAATSRFQEASLNYRRLFDSQTGFMRARKQDGSWVEPFDPFDWGSPYTEGNAWHWLWSVFHDVDGLVKLLGGDEAFAAKLDQVFEMPPVVKVGAYKRLIHEMSEMISLNMGQYAHANQPMQHALYLYNYVGQPWKSQERVRQVLDRLYNPSPRGLCGDEDTGQTSVWYLWSALGFYPVTPGHPSYVIGAPLFKRASLKLPNGKTFVIEAPNNNPANLYIRSARLNGKKLDRTFLGHDEIMRGGAARFEMGAAPNKSWATKRESRPFSQSSSDSP
jgi:predicted alpha-1,2-mannosidase